MFKVLNILFLILFSFSSQAEEFKILIWNPGAEGDAEIAAPLMQKFSQALSEKSKLKFKVTYSSALVKNAQSEFDQKAKHYDLLLISNDFLNLLKDLPSMLGQSVPEPSRATHQEYYLLGLKELAAEQKIKVIASYRLSPALQNKYKQFPQNYFSEKLAQKINYESSEDILGVVRDLENRVNTFIFMSDYEYHIIKKLKFDWAKKLKVLAISEPQPTPFFISKKWSPGDKKLDQVLKLLNNFKNKELLKELRLYKLFTYMRQ